MAAQKSRCANLFSEHDTCSETSIKNKRKRQDDVQLDASIGTQELHTRKKIGITLKAEDPDTQIAQSDGTTSSLGVMPKPLGQHLIVHATVHQDTKQRKCEQYNQSEPPIINKIDLTCMPHDIYTIMFAFLTESDDEFEGYTNQNEVWLYFLSLTSKKFKAIYEQYYQEKKAKLPKFLPFNLMTYLACNGHLNPLQFALENGFKWNYWTHNAAASGYVGRMAGVCGYAALNGHLHVLKYAHENGCEWDEMVLSSASMNGHLSCLQYALENGCGWDSNTCELAAMNGHLQCLKYAHEHDCEWNWLTCSYAAEYGHFECLRYAHENGCEWNEFTPMYAAKNGHLECLKYALENGCSSDKLTCTNAAQYGHLDCLQYAHEHGCEWNSATCQYAAQFGNLECLKYAHEHGCEWNAGTTSIASKNGHLECLQYALDNGCPYDPNYKLMGTPRLLL